MSPVGPVAPESWPPCPASSTIILSGPICSRPSRVVGSAGRATSSTSRGGSASVVGRIVPAAPSKTTRRSPSAPARSNRTSAINPSWIPSTRAPFPRPSSRTRASLGPLDSMRWGTAADVSTTIRVNEGYERTRTSSRVTSTAAATVRAGGAPAGAPATSVGTTRPTKDSGTSHTPCFTRTGASSITGLPLTSTRDQFRVNVTVLSRVRRWARVLAGVASSFVWSEAATRLSSTYGRPS